MNRTGASSNPFTQMVRQSRPNCVSIHLPFSVHVSVCVCFIWLCLLVCMCACMFACTMLACVLICLSVCSLMCACTRVYVCVCLYVCLYACFPIHLSVCPDKWTNVL